MVMRTLMSLLSDSNQQLLVDDGTWAYFLQID